MAFRIALLTRCFLAFSGLAAATVRIGVTTILSGQYADRGQSEQYGGELALERINEAGGVLGRPMEAFYGDNAADPVTGIAATKRLIEKQHVPVLLGALWTPVTHAIMPIVAEAKVPLVSDDVPFNRVNADSLEKAAVGTDIKVLTNETIAKDTKDLAPLLSELKALAPDRVVAVLSSSTAPFFRAYEQSGWRVPLTGRIEFPGAAGAVSPEFLASGGLDGATGITVFNPIIETPGVQDFIQAYRA